jgi:sulfoxide reductase heme-binding subunit YedZ
MLAATSTTMTEAVWYMIRATGVVSLVLLTVTTVLGLLSASRARTPRWPAFAHVDLHKRATMVALVFLGIHIASSVLDTYVHVGLVSAFVPFTSSFKPFWTGLGAVAVDLLAAVAVSSALRRRIAPRVWRGLHWLAYACWPVAMAHALGAGTDAAQLWMDAIAGACTVAVLSALTWRIGYHRTTRDDALRVGATTRAVPERHRPVALRTPGARHRRVGAGAGRTPVSTPAPAARPAATRLLERDPR